MRWSSSAAFSGARRPASRAARPPARNAARERLAPEPRVEVLVELGRLEQEPRAEAPHVAVRDVRAVV